MEDKDVLTVRQRRYCERYVIHWVGKTAAIEAGYSPKTAESQSSRLLSKAKVQKYIKTLCDELVGTEKAYLQFKVLKELQAVGFIDRMDFYYYDEDGNRKVKPFKDMKPEARRAAERINYDKNTVTVNINAKLKALELLGRYNGMFTDKLELSGGLDSKVEHTMNPEERLSEFQEILLRTKG